MLLNELSYIVDQLPRHPSKITDKRLKSPELVVLHTTNTVTSIQKLADYDVGPNHISDTGCPSFTYHCVVMRDGSAYQTLDWNEIAWHAGLYNKTSVAVAMMYLSQNKAGQDIYAPTQAQLSTTLDVLSEMCLTWKLHPGKVQGHRELIGTGWFWSKGSKQLRKTCPGLLVDMDKVRHGVAVRMQTVLKSVGLYTGELDGQFGKQSMQALENYGGIA